jgi:hypothetical protein
MFHFLKPSKIVLDCFTYSPAVITYSPIASAITHIPEWWKKLPKGYEVPNGMHQFVTMKHCSGVIQYYAKSIALPMWSELVIKIDSDRGYRWQFADGVSEAMVHPAEQRGDFLPDSRYAHLKIKSPWAFKTKTDLNWVWSHPVYNFENPEQFIVVPGVIEFKHQAALNINIVFDKTVPRNIEIGFNQVMAHITPMTDKKVEVRRHLITEQEYAKITASGVPSTFINKYGENKKAKEKFSNCPFIDHKNEATK